MVEISSISNAQPITPVRKVESAPQQEKPQPKAEEEDKPRAKSPDPARGRNVDILA
jgi:hypothetical protein